MGVGLLGVGWEHDDLEEEGWQDEWQVEEPLGSEEPSRPSPPRRHRRQASRRRTGPSARGTSAGEVAPVEEWERWPSSSPGSTGTTKANAPDGGATC